MAKKPKPDAEESDSPVVAKAKESDKKLLAELRERYTKCVAHDRENRRKYRENMAFALVPGSQWDKTVKKERGNDRPMYEFNEIRIKGKAIVNQIRANRPSAKITPAEGGDIDLAEAMTAEVDQIQNASHGDAIQDYAANHQVFGGMGAERYTTAWQEDSADRQDILIEPINNPMCLYADYACQKQDKSDARFWILATKLAKDVYKAKYPNANPVEFDFEDEFDDDCQNDDVWVAEYWKQKPIIRQLALLSDGKTVDLATVQALPPDVTVVKRRAAPGYEICQYICSGDAVLEAEELDSDTGKPVLVKEHPWAGKHFPFNIVYGEYTVIDGKITWSGITEFGKDAQRAHNWAMTSVFEAVASAPQGTTWVTEVQAANLTKEWDESVRKNIRLKRYNHDARAPGPPVSEPPASIPTALVAASQMSSDALKASLGMPDATLGETGAENSGVAIRRRQEAGAVANFNYGDNITNFIRRRYEILIDLIPKVKDTAYTLRVVGKDGAEKVMKINEIDPVTGNKLNDLSALKYDMVVTQGPNFATQRQEAAETYMGMQQSNPILGQVAGDLIMKSLDLPFAQEIGERLKATLPPQILAMLNKDKPQSPEVVAAMRQVDAMNQQVQEQAQAVQEASAQAQSDTAAATKAKSDVLVASANLKTQSAELATQEAELATKQAELARQVADFEKLVAETQAKFAHEDGAEAAAKAEDKSQSDATERDGVLSHVGQALVGIQEQIQGYAEQMAQLATAPRPSGAKRITTKRVNGKLVTTILDEATGTEKTAISERVNGEMVTAVQPSQAMN